MEIRKVSKSVEINSSSVVYETRIVILVCVLLVDILLLFQTLFAYRYRRGNACFYPWCVRNMRRRDVRRVDVCVTEMRGLDLCGSSIRIKFTVHSNSTCESKHDLLHGRVNLTFEADSISGRLISLQLSIK